MTTETTVEAKVLRFKVPIVVKKDVVGYHAFSPPLKGLHVDRDTKEETLKIGIKAAKLHLLTMIEHGDSIPLSLKADEKVSHVHILDKSVSYHIEDIQVDY
jgi:predicted RNase H-like HicB family nuclease